MPPFSLEVVKELVGFGEVARFETSGPNRVSELASIWRDQVSLAEVTDSLRIQCTGLVAFGSVTFSEDSTINSVLVVPRLVLGTRDGRSWITEILPRGRRFNQCRFPNTTSKLPPK